jgi:hypothetical protein
MGWLGEREMGGRKSVGFVECAQDMRHERTRNVKECEGVRTRGIPLRERYREWRMQLVIAHWALWMGDGVVRLKDVFQRDIALCM